MLAKWELGRDKLSGGFEGESHMSGIVLESRIGRGTLKTSER